MRIAVWCAPVKISNTSENTVLQALRFQQTSACCNLRGEPDNIATDVMSGLWKVSLMSAINRSFLNMG
jgi:hypothetical protein